MMVKQIQDNQGAYQHTEGGPGSPVAGAGVGVGDDPMGVSIMPGGVPSQ